MDIEKEIKIIALVEEKYGHSARRAAGAFYKLYKRLYNKTGVAWFYEKYIEYNDLC